MALCAGEVQLSVSPLKSLFIIHKAFPQPGFICAPPAGLPPQANPIQALFQPDVHCTSWLLGQQMLKVYRETIICNRKMKIRVLQLSWYHKAENKLINSFHAIDKIFHHFFPPSLTELHGNQCSGHYYDSSERVQNLRPSNHRRRSRNKNNTITKR